MKFPQLTSTADLSSRSCLSAFGQSCVLFQLLHFFRCCCLNDADTDSVKADKDAAQNLIAEQVLPIAQKLLRSFDPATVDAATGNNALHEMCTLFTLRNAEDWPFKLFRLLINRGVCVHARNRQGRTLLLQSAASMGALNFSAEGLRMFLRNGFDLNAQDAYGNGVLHHLVERKACAVLVDLLGSGGMGGLDLSLRNSAGQTAADLAAIRLAQVQHDAEDAPEHETRQWLETKMRARHIHQLLMALEREWERCVRPLLLRYVEAVLSVVDVAKLALGYIDGIGAPFTSAT